MNNLNVNNTRNCSIFLGVVLAVILLSVSGWGACSTYTDYIYTGTSMSGPDYRCKMNAVVSWAAGSAERPCVSGEMHGCSVSGTATSSTTIIKSCYYESDVNRTRVEFLQCGNQCETDSLQCINAGGTWTNTGASTCGGYSCKINHCKAADSTWLSTSIAACTGSNNYALVNTDSTCEHVGTCCPNDSIPSGNTCKWRCDSLLTQCNGRAGALFGAVLPDTSVSGEDTTFSYQCFYNCAYSPNPDSTVYLVEGNTVLAGPSDSISDGIKSEWFNSIRSTTGSIYVYDYLSPSASEYVDSIAAMKCVEHLWRCVINNKYVYWYDNQEVPAGCTNIVRVK